MGGFISQLVTSFQKPILDTPIQESLVGSEGVIVAPEDDICVGVVKKNRELLGVTIVKLA